MARTRQALNRFLGLTGQIERMATDPTHGHNLLTVTVLHDPYPQVDTEGEIQRCNGCGLPWEGLTAGSFLPPCTRPSEGVEIIVTYEDDPMVRAFEPAPALVQPADLPVEVIETFLSTMVENPPEPPPDPEILIPSDQELANMSEDQLDQLIARIREKQNAK